MIDFLNPDDLLKEITDYQAQHKELAEKALQQLGELSPPVMTVLVYNTEISNFQYLSIGIDSVFFASKEAKIAFVEQIIPDNLKRMVQQHLLPTALSMSMEATMRMGKPGMSMEQMFEEPPTDILIHTFETPEHSTVEMYKMLRKDVKVVNSDGDVIDEFDLERVELSEGDPEMRGLFANILKNFYENMAN